MIGQLITIVCSSSLKSILVLQDLYQCSLTMQPLRSTLINAADGKRLLSFPLYQVSFKVALGALCVALLDLASYGGYHGNIDLNSHVGFGYIFKYLAIVGLCTCVSLLVIPQLQFAKAKDKRNITTVKFKKKLSI